MGDQWGRLQQAVMGRARVARLGSFGRCAVVLMSLVAVSLTTGVWGADEPEEAAPARASARAKNKFRDFGEVTEGAKKHEGLFNLYQVDDHLYGEIRPQHMNQMFLAPIAIARGMASAGTPLNFGDEWVLTFKRVGDTIQLIRKNVHYEAPEGSPLERAMQQNYTDSILMGLPIVAINPATQGALIDFSAIFMSDFAGLGLGPMDRSRSSWHKVKTFENNVELEVEATFGSRFSSGESFGDDGVADPRGITLVIHYSLTKRPGPGYRPRFADQRVGHFISATKDFGSEDTDTTFVRRINRWRLEKANPQAKLSPPKKQIVWWVENTVPHEYRPYVEEGILEWNKAFEKVGFRNAIGVRWQNEQDEFDPEDINYCTFRWITTPSTYAMSGLRADPITGEMIDGDVIFDASWIRAWKQEYAFLVGAPIPTGESFLTGQLDILDVAEVISPIMAAKHGFGLPQPSRQQRLASRQAEHDHGVQAWLVPGDRSPLSLMLSQRLASGRFNTCQCASARQHEYTLAAMALAARASQLPANADEPKTDEPKKAEGEQAAAATSDEAPAATAAGAETPAKEDDKKATTEPAAESTEDAAKKKEAEKAKDKAAEELKLPEELIGQAIKEVVMHEVGHSLGLRHNFKASAMLSLDEINDPNVTRERGMVGSVMDYNPLNVARKGQPQGDYAMTTIGPYDYWAIEYAYTPIQGNEAEELKKIASRSSEPDLVYATDEDLSASSDPLVNAYDMGNDNLRYAKERIQLAQELLKNLDDSVVREGESWARLRKAFSVLFNQYGNGAYLAAAYIGGESFSRDFKGGDKNRDPLIPVPGDKQREALEFLVSTILEDEPFQFDPQMLRRLTTEHWYHWGSDMLSGTTEYNVYDRVLRIQQIVLQHCLDARVLRRLQNQKLMAVEGDKPLEITEVFRRITDGVWAELSTKNAGGQLESSLIRRNLQRDHLRRLCQIVVGGGGSTLGDNYAYVVLTSGSGGYPADARSLARVHLRELHDRLDVALKNGEVPIEPATRAHFEECREVISKVLSAEMTTNQP